MHEEPQIKLPEEQAPERRQFSFALFVATAAVVIVVAGFYLWPGRQSPSRGAQDVHPPFGPAERAYASKIAFENLALSRAENFLHQEVTTLAGDVVNSGDRALSEVEITVEFLDQVNQVVLREARLVVTSASPPLGPGARQTFEISFEHLPAMWNNELPSVHVTGLRFATTKW
jgi:hypothetical protein